MRLGNGDELRLNSDGAGSFVRSDGERFTVEHRPDGMVRVTRADGTVSELAAPPEPHRNRSGAGIELPSLGEHLSIGDVTVCAQPGGVRIIDGEVTHVLGRDGWTSTHPSAANPETATVHRIGNDGTIKYSGNGVEETIRPNGSVSHKDSDGTHVIKPDGVGVRTPAERSASNAEAGGAAPTEAHQEQAPREKTVVTHPDGTTQTVRTDKTMEVRTPGDTTVNIDAKRNVTVHVSNETTIAVERKQVTVRSLNGDSYAVERKTVTVHTPDGTSYVVDPRRNTITRTAADRSAGDANSIAAHTGDGTVHRGPGHPNSTHTTDPDGTVRVRLDDGSTISIGRDGSVRVGLENGRATSVRADGVVRVTVPDRNATVVRSDGVVWQVDPDGITLRRTSPDGSTWTVDADGTIHQNKPDGTEKVHGTELSGTDLKSKTRPKRVPGARPKPSWVGIPDVPTAADWIAGASLPGSDGSTKPPE